MKRIMNAIKVRIIFLLKETGFFNFDDKRIWKYSKNCYPYDQYKLCFTVTLLKIDYSKYDS